jgi:hypothetical protein
MNRWVVATAALLVGISGACSARTPTGRWENPAELTWQKTWGIWSDTMYARGRTLDAAIASLRASAGQTPTSDVVRATRPFAHCRARADGALGKPPTPRLMAVFRLIRHACAHFESASRAIEADPRHTLAFGILTNDLAYQLDDGWDLFNSALHRSKVGETQPLPIVVKTPASTDVSYTSPTLNRVAGVLARKRMTVHCWSVADWRSLGREVRALRLGKFDSDTIGWAEVRGNRIELAPSICRQLSLLLRGVVHPHDFQQSEAVLTLAHEAQHARGVDSEAIAECFAIQRVPLTADELGLSRSVGTAMSREVWDDYSNELPGYRTSGCHNGGPFDLYPHSNVWP